MPPSATADVHFKPTPGSTTATSGGPLVNLEGHVAALASFVGHHQPQWGINSGVGFGTTAKTIVSILDELRGGATIDAGKRTQLGVFWDASSFEEKGARVRAVVEGSGAEKAGVQPGDVLVGLDDEPIETFNQLRRMIYFKKPGDVIRLKLVRGDETLTVEATLGARER